MLNADNQECCRITRRARIAKVKSQHCSTQWARSLCSTSVDSSGWFCAAAVGTLPMLSLETCVCSGQLLASYWQIWCWSVAESCALLFCSSRWTTRSSTSDSTLTTNSTTMRLLLDATDPLLCTISYFSSPTPSTHNTSQLHCSTTVTAMDPDPGFCKKNFDHNGPHGRVMSNEFCLRV